MPDITFEVTKRLGVLSVGSKGWEKQVNYVSWNGRDPKIDIREWSPDGSKMGKGITLTDEEAAELMKLLQQEMGD